MTDDLDPIPSGKTRHLMATRVRNEATLLADIRVPPQVQRDNGATKAALRASDETFIFAPGTFTKGLSHDRFGRVKVSDLRKFVSEINQDAPGSAPGETPFPGTYRGDDGGYPAPFNVAKYGGEWNWPTGGSNTARNWESPLAGHTLEINGPDPDDLQMPPAPALGSSELIAEIAELYAMAYIRDIPFTKWEDNENVRKIVEILNKLEFYKADNGLDEYAKRRRSARLQGEDLSGKNLFRGSTPGAHKGPYISQFMLIGNSEQMGGPKTPPADAMVAINDAQNRAGEFFPTQFREARVASGRGGREAGLIKYGPQAISQTIVPHLEKRDHMTDWGSWLDVQNGANRKGLDYYNSNSRFITTPRDIATYVHFDALYQAYLNACLILLDEGASSDLGLPEAFGAKGGHPTRDGFALYGGPHILTLVCECATRALKAVRRQKYNIHLRGRPEHLAAAIAAKWSGVKDGAHSILDAEESEISDMMQSLEATGLLQMISDHNKGQNDIWKNDGWPVDLFDLSESKNALLPMAFPEGSPMHPAYGAGHATVAGACVTILKAFFEMFSVVDGRYFRDGKVERRNLNIKEIMNNPKIFPEELFSAERTLEEIGINQVYIPDETSDGDRLLEIPSMNLSIQGELDKLAANVAIGRNFAGVHYYTDYYESIRMGERIAVGMLQEQILTYREPISMRLTSFDGDFLMLIGTGGSRGSDDSSVLVWNSSGESIRYLKWWQRS